MAQRKEIEAIEAQYELKLKSKNVQIKQLRESLQVHETMAETKITEARQRMIRAEKSASEKIESEYN